MDLNLYFDPVSLSHEGIRNVPDTDSFSHKLKIHTPDFPISHPTIYDIAIFGVPEDRSALIHGSALGPDKIRQKLYALAKVENKLKIVDLGNMKPGKTVKDTYAGLQDVVIYLLSHDVVPVVLGGSQDLTLPVAKAFLEEEELVHLVTIDSRIDLLKDNKEILSDTWLEQLIKDLRGKIRVTNLGHQEFLTSRRNLKLLRSKGHESYRLGEVRANLSYYESYIRDGDLISIDMCAVRQSYAPGVTNPVPGGFEFDDICQISRYAGLSQHIRLFSIFEMDPDKDVNGQTASVAAQSVWYFISGFAFRKKENPESGGTAFTEYILSIPDSEYKLVFRKSEETGRWWLRIPDDAKSRHKRNWIACSHEDYLMASRHEIPPRWFDIFKK